MKTNPQGIYSPGCSSNSSEVTAIIVVVLDNRILSILSAKRIPRTVRVERNNETRKLRGSIRVGGQSSALHRLSPSIDDDDDAARILPARGIDDRIDLLDHTRQHTQRLTAPIISVYSFYSITRLTVTPSLLTVSLSLRRNRWNGDDKLHRS